MTSSFPPLNHEFWMRQALDLAVHAASLGEIPVGAIIVHHPENAAPRIIGQGFNQRETDRDPSAHAEIVAMRQAGKTLGHWRLTDCTLYVTLEPCPMCAGALVQSRLPRLVYGCPDPKAGAVHSLFSLCTDPRLNHRLDILPGILSEESATVLKTFFAARRAPKPQIQTCNTSNQLDPTPGSLYSNGSLPWADSSAGRAKD